MIIHSEKRWVVITPPKTGSTTANLLLRSPAFGGRLSWDSSGWDHHNSEVPGWASDFRRFITVRDPFARASSLYRWHLREHRVYGHPEPARPFSGFISRCLAGEMHGIFSRLMTDYASDATPIRLERLHDDVRTLEPDGAFNVPHENRDAGALHWSDAYRDDPDARDVVARWAAPDFERFEYPGQGVI